MERTRGFLPRLRALATGLWVTCEAREKNNKGRKNDNMLNMLGPYYPEMLKQFSEILNGKSENQHMDQFEAPILGHQVVNLMDENIRDKL